MMREIRQSRDTPQWRDSEESWWRGGHEYNRKPLCVHENAVTRAALGRAAQGPNRHDSCAHQPTSRRQFHERYLPSLAVEPQLLPDSAESLVLNVNTSPTQVSTKPAPVSLFEDCPGTP